MSKRSILLDTQLLVLLAVGATDPDLIHRHKRTRGAYTRDDFTLLLDLLGFQPRFGFCAQAAAEASNLVDQHAEPQRSRVMAVLRALLNNAIEIAIPCRTAMEMPEFISLGLADAAQLALCTPESVLLTDDEPLFRAATAKGLQALSFSEERLYRSGEG